MEIKEGLPVKVPMSLAVANLAQIMEAIDEGQLNDTITKMFNETRLDLASAIDRRICFFDFAAGQLETLKKLSTEYAAAAKRIEYVIKKVSEGTIQIMDAGPEEFSYQGNLGRVQAQNNAFALKLLIETKSKSFSHLIRDDEATDIPMKYVKDITFRQIDTKAVKEDLEKGELLSWATLEKGRHLRIYRK